jgi:hypothetical protein
LVVLGAVLQVGGTSNFEGCYQVRCAHIQEL